MRGGGFPPFYFIIGGAKMKRNKKNQGFKINRFPICAIVHYAVAKKLGYEDRQAKAIGQACAIFYACAKNGYFVRGSKSKSKKSSKAPKITHKLRFCDRIFNATEINGILYPVMGDKVITEKDFDKTLNSKLSKNEINLILEHAFNYVSQFPEFALYRPFELYKRVRDEWRTHEFWNKLINENTKKEESVA